jgi:Fe-S-cluster-containing hydrogenase component 2
VINLYYPLRSLKEGHWFKLICGASFQHLPAIQNLVLAYALAGADCVDVAADAAVVAAAREALDRAERYWRQVIAPTTGCDRPWVRPLLMVSLNDGDDPHFRKACFDPAHCPADCPRPCEPICPAQAIAFPPTANGVIAERCYGCGRCVPICPLNRITTAFYQFSPADLGPLVNQGVDAIEIHTQVGREAAFESLWAAIAPVVPQLACVAVSCPDGDGIEDYLRSLDALMQPRPPVVVWQADGRPMSGDIGDGTTHATLRLGQKLLAAHLPGYVQLAGGTNGYTVEKLRSLHLLAPTAGPQAIAGVAYGSYARKLLSPVLDALDERQARASPPAPRPSPYLEYHPDLLESAMRLAHALIDPLKRHPSLLIASP